MRRDFAFLAAGFVLATVLYLNMGAAANRDYLDACQAIDGEYSYFLFLNKTAPDYLEKSNAMKKRVDHWSKVIEQFKP